jgi:protein TonB
VALRWTATGLAVIGGHAGAMLGLNWPAAAEVPGYPPAAII